MAFIFWKLSGSVMLVKIVKVGGRTKKLCDAKQLSPTSLICHQQYSGSFKSNVHKPVLKSAQYFYKTIVKLFFVWDKIKNALYD